MKVELKSIKGTWEDVANRGFCPEMWSCNYDKTEVFQKEVKKYRQLKEDIISEQNK